MSCKSVRFKYLKEKPYWGNHLWSKGYYVDTVGLDAEMIKKEVRFQENNDRREVNKKKQPKEATIFSLFD
jgi:REP element-mobilizing transposase RayT